MQHSARRRSLLFAGIATPFLSVCTPLFARTQEPQLKVDLQAKLAQLEKSTHGRIGLATINTADHTSPLQYRADERFPVCSTSKVLVVAAILKKSMTDDHLLEQRVTYTQEDVTTSGYAPITEKHLTTGMSIDELCAAAIQYSDNTAANLLIKELGGPKAVTTFARSIGDQTFRLDRWEPALNTAIPNDLRDTSTPNATINSLQKLVFGKVLALPQREQLLTWLSGNTTGNARIRAGVPPDWRVGDKTGTGAYGTTNDVGIIWPPHGAPIIVAIFFTQYGKNAKPRDDVIASVTQLLVSERT